MSDQLLTGFDSKFVNIIYMDKILVKSPDSSNVTN
ncbi:type I restriction enzyme subunit R domain-containing protein [Pediococcus damnosus]